MRLFRFLFSVALLGASTLTASADGPRDRVEADSFGNLVIWSSAGYKRIVVGKGHLAGELNDYVQAGEPRVVYGTDDRNSRDTRRVVRDCYRPPVLFKGRAHMYGLSDGEIPRAPCQSSAD